MQAEWFRNQRIHNLEFQLFFPESEYTHVTFYSDLKEIVLEFDESGDVETYLFELIGYIQNFSTE